MFLGKRLGNKEPYYRLYPVETKAVVYSQISDKDWLRETTQKILEIIKENPTITRKGLASITGISEGGIKFHISNLKKNGLLRRVGPDKGGYWEVVEVK